MNNKRYNKIKVVKRTIEVLSITPDSEVLRTVLPKSLDGVVRAIRTAALNEREGVVRIPPHLKHIFDKYHRHIHQLTDNSCLLSEKRRLLV